MATHEEAMFPELEGLKPSRSYAVHPACGVCHRLYPRMKWLTQFWAAGVNVAVSTSCCDSEQVNWKFLVGTRKGKVNLTVRSRVAAFQKRGVWAALSM